MKRAPALAAAPPAVDWERRGPLKVPLKAETVTHGGRSSFVIWSDERGRVHRPAREPGMWSTSPEGRVVEAALKRRLSDTTAAPTRWYRLAFDRIADVRDFVAEKKHAGLSSYLGDDDRWAVRVLVERPDYFPRFAHKKPLRILTVDVEQRSAGGLFPPRDAPLVSIALGHADGTRPRVAIARKDSHGEPDDAPIIRAWRDAIERYNPHVIAAYNAPYDLGVLVERAAKHGFPLDEWGRLTETGERSWSHAYVETSGRKSGKRSTVYVGGRVVWDVYANANPVTDYNLSGIKDSKLKRVGAFLGLPVIEEDTGETLALWRDNPRALVRYNANDVVLLEYLVARYLPDRLALAEFYGAPLDVCLSAPSGWGGTIASARTLYAEGIISDGTNYDRHREWLKGRVSDLADIENDDEGVRQFAGAHIQIYKKGLFAPLWKVDFASLYPRVLVSIGCGPDNTRIVGTEPLGDFRVDRDGDVALIHMPDTNYRHSWLIEVRGTSVFTPILASRMEDRLKAKRAAHAAEERGDMAEAAAQAARANILKTQLNAMFGAQAALFNRYGVYPVAILAAGYARELIRAIEVPLGHTKIETDTDGVYVTAPHDLAHLDNVANAHARRWGFAPVFEVEGEDFPAGYFHGKKMYLLLSKKGVVKRYGAAMKGKAHPAIFDRIMEDVGGALLRTRDRSAALAIARERLDLSKYEPREFIQRATLGKSLEHYKHPTKETKVALAHEAANGTPPTPGLTYEYVRTAEGLVPPTPANLARLDEHAYLTKVCLKALERLGFTDLVELGVKDRAALLAAQAKRAAKRRRNGSGSQKETSLFAFDVISESSG